MAKRDDFDDEQDGAFGQILSIVGQHKRTFAAVSVIAAVMLLGLIVWGTYPDEEDMAQNGNAPIIRADAESYKTAPDDPGGMEIPYRDSTVFSSMQSGGQKQGDAPENILADEGGEEPLPRDQLFAGLKTDPKAAPVEGQVVQGQAVAPDQAPSDQSLTQAPSTTTAGQGEVEDVLKDMAKGTPTVAPTQKADVVEPSPAVEAAKVEPVQVPESAPVAKAPVKTEAVKTIAKTEPAAGTTASKAVQPGGYYIQLASVKDDAKAGDEWKKLQVKYTALSGLKYRTQKADLAKGTFYRIQAGPMAKESATSICDSIKKTTPGACLMVAK